MVPLGREATERVLSWDDGLHRTVALHHAAIQGRPGLWGDHPERPTSVVWLREGDGQWEAFAAGYPGPALDWLATEARGRPITLASPPSWEDSVRTRADRVERRFTQTWLRPRSRDRPKFPTATVRLGPGDSEAFGALAPGWALRAWGRYEDLIARGAAFGVRSGRGLASMAWTFECNHQCDKLGVATLARYRGLGLGRASASALVEHITRDRRKQPLWTTNPGNAASMALARSLGFSARITEVLLGWTPR